MSHIVIDVDDWFYYSEVEFTGRKTPEPISLISSDEEDIPVYTRVFTTYVLTLRLLGQSRAKGKARIE